VGRPRLPRKLENLLRPPISSCMRHAFTPSPLVKHRSLTGLFILKGTHSRPKVSSHLDEDTVGAQAKHRHLHEYERFHHCPCGSLVDETSSRPVHGRTTA
jgi:hypothetical protein